VTDSTAFIVVALLAIAIQSFLLFLALFEPGLRYKIADPRPGAIRPEHFLRTLEALTDARIRTNTRVETLANGTVFYEAELEAVRNASQSVCLEAYIFQPSVIGDRLVAALAERAQTGVKVNIVLDAIGSFATTRRYFSRVIESGGRLEWYHPIRWNTWPRINNRTHRELLIVDGRAAFIGGAGIADQWFRPRKKAPVWRDYMFRVTGDAVTSLQASFAENWLESSGEILMGDAYFPFSPPPHAASATALVVNSSPSVGRSTRARILYQTLLACSRKSIQITTPYFLPDRSARAEMVHALRERGVRVRILVPGKKADHLLTRRSSRRLYGELLAAGAEIYEYTPGMLHAKCMVIDGSWTVVGSTNFDHRSFGLNDEVNLAVRDRDLAERLNRDFEQDLASSRPVRLRAWRRRPIYERIHEWLGWLLERQQ
jgi:cardiolipin synthase A/B